jgi:hypothetical protein
MISLILLNHALLLAAPGWFYQWRARASQGIDTASLFLFKYWRQKNYFNKTKTTIFF